MRNFGLFKKFACLILLMGMSFTVNARTMVDLTAVEQGSKYVTITGTGVRLRFGPGLDYGYYKDAKGVAITPKKGQQMELIGESGDWYEVKYGDDVAYVFKQYATIAGNATVASASMVEVTGTGVRLRKGPGLNYDFLKGKNGSIRGPKKGERLVCIGETSDWYKVKYANGTYYIFKQYAKKLK